MNITSFKFKDFTVEHVTKKNLKNSYISITNDAQIILKTPKVSEHFIFDLLNKKESWIRKKYTEALINQSMQINIEDEVLLFGEIYSIDMPQALELRKKLQRLKIPSKEKIYKCYNSFYKEQSVQYITKRVEYYSELMECKYVTLKFRKMKSRWGSCSSSKILTFNTELMKIEKVLIDYVVVHELAHLTHMNHSKVFHSLVDKYLQDSKEYRKKLKKLRISIF